MSAGTLCFFGVGTHRICLLLCREIQRLRETVIGADNFLDKAKWYTDITELTPELLRLFIE